ncbi:hypothetical protein BG004_004588 [Podila humilis]|nr:hypothetical protein BG004_004588 [Podila humilis]
MDIQSSQSGLQLSQQTAPLSDHHSQYQTQQQPQTLHIPNEVSPVPSSPSSPPPEMQVMGMHPIQPITSNQSVQSNQSAQSYQSAQSFESAQSSQSSNTGNAANEYPNKQTNRSVPLAPPVPEKSGKSRRWSLTGRFFEKRKSVTEPFHVSGSHPLEVSAAYNAIDSNIVHDGGGGGGMNQSITAASNKQTTPPESNGSSRRSSLADIPKAILSSLLRVSLSSSSDSMAKAADTIEEGDDAEAIEIDENATTLMNGQASVTIAVPKAPPKDPWDLLQFPAPKSILKKFPPEAATSVTGGHDAGAATATAIAGGNGAGDSASGSKTGDPSDYCTSYVHPMATSGDAVLDMIPPSDHRARLLTHSPTPNHPQQQHLASSSRPSMEAREIDDGHLKVPGQTNGNGDQVMGMSLPPDVSAPGMQSNSIKDRDAVGLPLSSRAQVLSNQYYELESPQGQQQQQQQQSYNMPAGTINGAGLTLIGGVTSSGTYGSPGNMHSLNSMAGSNGAGVKRRSINFLETVEIIPAHRKAEYNRQSDKYATFKVLTPDLKSEIRDELNTYKMREMAVHVESMGNTAFH